MKTCSKCEETKAPAEFLKESRCKDGLMGQCVMCHRAQKAKWRDMNREHYRREARDWGRKNATKLSAKAKERYKENPTKYKESVKAYRKRRPWVKREWEWKQKYGIGRAEYNEMLAKQGGGCALCGAKPEEQAGRSTHKHVLYVDHDHATGKVRGLLCNQHNRAIGLFGDDAELLIKAAMYLAEHGNSRIWLPIAA